MKPVGQPNQLEGGWSILASAVVLGMCRNSSYDSAFEDATNKDVPRSLRPVVGSVVNAIVEAPLANMAISLGDKIFQ